MYSTPVYLALLMVVSGVALVSCRDGNFSSFSLMAGMVSNAAFALYSIYAKRAMQAPPEHPNPNPSPSPSPSPSPNPPHAGAPG